MNQLTPDYHTLRALIIDDEACARSLLARFLQNYCPDVALIGAAPDLQTAAQLIEQHRPNLLFLDIHLGPDCGFDLLDRFPAGQFQVIFATAYDEFALRAFRYGAADFLLKPIHPAEFVQAVFRARQRRTLPDLNFLVSLFRQVRPAVGFEKIALHSQAGLTILRLAEVTHLVADRAYTTFHTSSDERVFVCRGLGEFADLLPAEQFFRVHVSHLVNLDFVKKVLWEEGGCVVLKCGAKLPLARRRKEAFLARLHERVNY